jgi:hypothetical protein
MTRIFSLLAMCLLPMQAYALGAGKELQVIRMTPSGEDVPASQQLVLQFNRPVVPLGKMEREASEIPVIITPALACEWRWINTSALACNLPEKEPMKLATAYTLDMQPGIAAEDGGTLAEAYHQTFITQRPRISYTQFRQWKSPTLPVIRVVFDQPVDMESVKQHVFFALGDDATRSDLQVRPDPLDEALPEFLPIPGEKAAIVLKGEKKRKSDDHTTVKNGREARRIWLVEPAKELPADTHVVLKLEPGLVSALGEQPSVEARDEVAFDTYPAFSFLGVKCTDNEDAPIWIPAGQKPEAKCNPMRGVQFSFSAPVDRAHAAKMLSFTPLVGGWSNAVDDDEPMDDSSAEGRVGYQYRAPHVKGNTYQLSLPRGLKAAQLYSATSRVETMHWWERLWRWLRSWVGPVEPVEPRDIFGRELSTPLSAQFETGHRNPNYVLDYSDAVLESNVDSELPLYVNNLQSYQFSYRSFMDGYIGDSRSLSRDVPEVKDVQFAVKFGLRDILKGRSGAVYGMVSTTPYVHEPQRLFAEVSPYQAQVKLGHFSSLVWVTNLKTGEPVAGAKVGLFTQAFTELHKPEHYDAQAVTDEDGVAVLPGTETLDADLSVMAHYRDDETHFFVKVSKGNEMALVPLSYNFMVNNYRASGSDSVYPSNKQRYGHMHTWGMTAQGIYRAGDTIQYKLYVRNQNDDGFVPPPGKGYSLKVIDPMGAFAIWRVCRGIRGAQGCSSGLVPVQAGGAFCEEVRLGCGCERGARRFGAGWARGCAGR